MPTMPWKAFIPPSPDGEYLVMASSLPLKRYLATPRFVRYVMAIRNQLAGAGRARSCQLPPRAASVL